MPPELITRTAEAALATSTPTSQAEKQVLYVGIMVHLEGWNDDKNENRFADHVRLMREYAGLFETYGAKLTWESKEVTDGVLKWGDNVLLEMQQRGHGIGVHADIGGERDFDCSVFADQLHAAKVKLEQLGVTVRHVSGNTSHCDWVQATIDAGYQFTTGQVAYSVMSFPEDQRPEEYRDCPNPGACHQVFPPDLEDRITPWRPASGENWLANDPNARLVLLPSSGVLPCLEEDAGGSSSHNCEFTEKDIDLYFEELEQALALAHPGQVNTYYVAWSFGQELDMGLLEEWLQRLDAYVRDGRVIWKTLPEMYDLFVDQ